jgi:hypothetical protein
MRRAKYSTSARRAVPSFPPMYYNQKSKYRHILAVTRKYPAVTECIQVVFQAAAV